jgi:hypothetical protein
MTTSEWRQQPELVARAGSALNDEIVREMLNIITQESPIHPGVNLRGTTDGDKMTFLGRVLGYNEAIAKLRSLDIIDLPPQHLEVKFLPEEEPFNVQLH